MAPEPHATADGGDRLIEQRQTEGGAAADVPGSRAFGVGIRLKRLHEEVRKVEIVAQFRRTADAVIAGDGAWVVAAADLAAAECDLFAGDEGREGILSLCAEYGLNAAGSAGRDA